VDFQIFYTEPSLTDLEEICGRSWGEHPGSTVRFTGSLLNHVELLADFPELGARWLRNRSVRRLLHSPFHIYYRVRAEQRRVEILRIWHVNRNPPRLRPTETS
jgi:plasmid stabilization system protein ParE